MVYFETKFMRTNPIKNWDLKLFLSENSDIKHNTYRSYKYEEGVNEVMSLLKCEYGINFLDHEENALLLPTGAFISRFEIPIDIMERYASVDPSLMHRIRGQRNHGKKKLKTKETINTFGYKTLQQNSSEFLSMPIDNVTAHYPLSKKQRLFQEIKSSPKQLMPTVLERWLHSFTADSESQLLEENYNL